MRIVVATHGNCMDGLASAVLFTHLMRTIEPSSSEFVYRACIYGPKQLHFGLDILDGDINAILDYRFYGGPELDWYFDHHSTAFLSESEELVFRDRAMSGRFYFDSTSPSCAGLIGKVMTERWGIQLGHHKPLIEFADQVDSAQFASAAAALDRSTALSRLMAVVERHGNNELYDKMVGYLLERRVQEVAELPEITSEYAQIAWEQTDFINHVRSCSENRGAIVVSDITDREHATFAKFASYALFPQSTYSVLLGRIPGAIKIALGHNPWGPQARSHDLGEICRSFGGGGHLVVGGVAFGPDDISTARTVMTEIVSILEKS
jgi:hypothetical protein